MSQILDRKVFGYIWHDIAAGNMSNMMRWQIWDATSEPSKEQIKHGIVFEVASEITNRLNMP